MRLRRSAAFTLIEILVSLTITMMMMGAVVTLFGVMTDSVSGSRSIIEMTERLRSCRNRLQADLQGVTVGISTGGLQPPLRPENDEGYFEAIEGQNTDTLPNASGLLYALDPRYGDTDDILLFTTRSAGEPFVGQFNGVTAESQTVEVAWFMVPNTAVSPPTFTLYRRVRLVSPQLTGMAASDDVSAHLESGVLKANSLGDLTKPENRWLHVQNTVAVPFPYRLNTTAANLQTLPFAGARLADDVILTNVLAFDVQLYDPTAPIYLSGGVTVEQRDAGFSTLIGAPPSAAPIPARNASGSYVDLGYFNGYAALHLGADLSAFSDRPNTKSGIAAARTVANPYAYDTWSLHYENDAVLQMSTVPTGSPIADAGANGLDDDGVNGVDDLGEYDTLPPYSSPLRGIRVTIRTYEPSSQQVREVSIVQDFLPE